MLIAANSFAQCCDTTKPKSSYYVSAGISMSNQDAGPNKFKEASFLSMEIGMSRKNVSFGADFGFENLMMDSVSTRKYYELKTAISHPIGNCSGYVLFGVGAFFTKTFNNFIEYGAGFSYTPCKVGYFAQYSNWAGTNYISTGFIYNF